MNVDRSSLAICPGKFSVVSAVGLLCASETIAPSRAHNTYIQRIPDVSLCREPKGKEKKQQHEQSRVGYVVVQESGVEHPDSRIRGDSHHSGVEQVKTDSFRRSG